jgi:hypothetical protein
VLWKMLRASSRVIGFGKVNVVKTIIIDTSSEKRIYNPLHDSEACWINKSCFIILVRHDVTTAIYASIA